MIDRLSFIFGHVPGIERRQATASSLALTHDRCTRTQSPASCFCNLPQAPAINRPLNSPALRLAPTDFEARTEDGGNYVI